MAPSREMELLLRCLRSFAGTEPAGALQGPSPGLNRRLFSRIALCEGVAGIVADRLNSPHPDLEVDCPDEIREEAQHTFVRGGAYWAEVQRLRGEAESAGVPVMLLKGAALLATVYGKRFSLRPLSDIDLLVRPQDLPKLGRIVRGRGLAAYPEGSLCYLNGKLAVDLHLDLVGAQRIRSRAGAYRMDHAALWSASRPWPPRGAPLRGGLRLLAPEHQFLHLCVHALKHSYSRLIWLVDLALTWRQTDPQRVLHEARSFGMQRPLLYALRGLRDLLGLDSVEPCLVRLPRPNRLENLFLAGMTARRVHSLGCLVSACSVPGWGNRLNYLSESAFPRRQVMSEMFAGTHPWLAYLRRAGRLLHTGIREVERSVFSLRL